MRLRFYIIQLLESDTGSDYKVWTRWGLFAFQIALGRMNVQVVLVCPARTPSFLALRCSSARSSSRRSSRTRPATTGPIGLRQHMPPMMTALVLTHNRAHFVKVAGKYDLVQIDYAADDTAEIESALAVPKPIKPKIVGFTSTPQPSLVYFLSRNRSSRRRSSRSWSSSSTRSA
jgi:hypothetical protein